MHSPYKTKNDYHNLIEQYKVEIHYHSKKASVTNKALMIALKMIVIKS